MDAGAFHVITEPAQRLSAISPQYPISGRATIELVRFRVNGIGASSLFNKMETAVPKDRRLICVLT